MRKFRGHLPALSYGRTLAEICCGIVGCPPFFDPNVAPQARSEAAKAWAAGKQAETEVKAAAVRAAWQLHAAAVSAVQKAEENIKSADMEVQKLLKTASDQTYRTATDRERARIQAAKAWADVMKKDREIKFSAERVALQACREAEGEVRKAEEDAKAANEIAEGVVQTAADLAEKQAKAETKRHEEGKARKEAKRRQEAEAKVEAKRRAQEEAKKTSKEAAADAKRTAAKRAAKEAKRRAKIEAWAAPTRTEKEAKRITDRKEQPKAESAAKREGRKAKRKPVALVAGRKAKSEAKPATQKALQDAGISANQPVLIDDFAEAATVPRETAMRLVRSGLLKAVSSRPHVLIDRQEATKFLQSLVSVEEILQRWPEGERLATVLEQGKVPPALSQAKFGTVFYRRDYATSVFARLT